MAQLKDLIVNGASQLIGDVYTSQIQISKLNAPTTAGGTTYGAGSSGQALLSNGTTVYWGNISTTDTKVNVQARGTTKSYLLATTTSPTSTATGVTAVAETGVYLDTTAAKLVATTFEGTATSFGKGSHAAAVTTNEFAPTTGTVTLVGNVSNTTMPKNSNANAEMIIKAHPTSGTNYYEARLGFSSNSNLYYMPVNGTSWKQIAYTDSVSSTDEKVKYDKSTSNTAFKVLAGANGSPTNGTCTGTAVYCDNITLNPSNGVFRATKVYGAVFNDYAEYREIKDDILPGNCVVENGDGTLKLTTERLMRGCEIISDTYGFAIGQTKQCQTPVAVSGRVLAYCLEGKEIAKNYIGWPVCSGPNGTVSIMTEEEEIKYPSRIIGTISEIPNYEIWGDNQVKVNNRIWIRIK